LHDDRKMFHLDIERAFDDVPRPDVLVVPGGFIDPRTGPLELAAEGGSIIDRIRAAHEHTTFPASVCTGGARVGQAGLLDGLRATTHWAAYDALRSFGAEPTEQRVVFQGKIVTGAGVSAGIDLALAVLAELRGPEMAQAIQLAIEYDPDPPLDSGAVSKAPAAIRDLVLAIAEAASRSPSQPDRIRGDGLSGRCERSRWARRRRRRGRTRRRPRS
jgi:transcriptional regulator GlxA family with amidase domain